MSRKSNSQQVLHILQAANAVFARAGLDAARMEDIAAAAGVSKGALYLHFQNKDALIIALAQQIFEQQLADFRRVAQSPGTAQERVKLLAQAMIGEFQSRREALPVIYEFFALGLRRPEARRCLEDFFEQSVAILVAVIQDGIASGELQAVDARLAAVALGGLIDGVLLWHCYQPQAADAEAQVNLGVGLLLEALTAKS